MTDDQLKSWIEHFDMRLRLLESEAAKSDPSYPDRLRDKWLKQLGEKVKRGDSVVYDHHIVSKAVPEIETLVVHGTQVPKSMWIKSTVID